MAPPLLYEPSSFTEAAKAVSHAAWTVSEVAWTLLDNAAAVTSPSIKFNLHAALYACQKELATVQREAEQVAVRVKTAAGVLFGLDNHYGMELYDGGDYDTRHNRQPFVFEPYTPFGQFGQYPLVPPKLPGE